DILSADIFAFPLSSCLKGRHLFFMAAGTDKSLVLSFSDKLHPFMADRTSGIGCPRNRLTISALPILADKQFTVLSIDCQHPFSAPRTFPVCQIVMPEGRFACTDVLHHIVGILLNLFHERLLFLPAVRNFLQFLLPSGCQLRLFQI